MQPAIQAEPAAKAAVAAVAAKKTVPAAPKTLSHSHLAKNQWFRILVVLLPTATAATETA